MKRSYTFGLLKRYATGKVRLLSVAEVQEFQCRMAVATEHQRKEDERATAMSELHARDKWLG